jgi:hypothetical protein
MSENEFNRLFVSEGIYTQINAKNKNLFQRRIMGLVSYYVGSTPDVFATKSIKYVDVVMSDYQKLIYNYYEDIEKKIALKSMARGGSQVYKSYTRQACNFVFPNIDQDINGENRPRPNKFKVSEREAEKLAEGRDKKVTTNVSAYKNALERFISATRNYFNNNHQEDIKNKHTIQDDVKNFMSNYDSDFEKFHKNEKKKSNLYKAMYTCSGKMLNIAFNIEMSKGPTIVYSNYVLMEGLEVFKIYLSFFNYYNFMEARERVPNKIGYTEFHGGIKEMKDRKFGMDAYNKDDNLYGKYIKIMLVSPAGSEGLSLFNVRQVHIMEPYWHETRITQIIGRGIRQCGHKLLKKEERHVDVYRYRSVRPDASKWTTDQYIEDLARNKESLIGSFLDALKEVAIDCALFKAHNMLNDKYKCFQFDEQSLLSKRVGPAYKEDIYEDSLISSGSNAPNSVTMKIKVIKITAVKVLPDDKYSKPKKYWYYQKSGVVYDLDLHYVVGRIGMDNNGMPKKLDADTYIIDHVVPIPHLE